MASTPYSLIRTSHVFHPVVTWICMRFWRYSDLSVGRSCDVISTFIWQIQLLSSLSLYVKTTKRHLGNLAFGWGTALFRWTKNWRQSFKWDLQLVWSAVAVLPGNMAMLSWLSEMFKKKSASKHLEIDLSVCYFICKSVLGSRFSVIWSKFLYLIIFTCNVKISGKKNQNTNVKLKRPLQNIKTDCTTQSQVLLFVL